MKTPRRDIGPPVGPPANPPTRPTLAQRRHALQQRSTQLRERLAGDARVIDAALGHGLGLSKVALGAAGLGTALVALRRRAGWRRMGAALRLLPLAWGVWHAMKAARTRR